MKINILPDVHPYIKCAFCESGSIQNWIIHLAEEDSRQLRLCNHCVDDLRREKGTSSCAFCGKFADYGTRHMNPIRERGKPTPADFHTALEYRLLCKEHFDEKHEEIHGRERQSTIKDWKD
jgi:hypothetical protein